MFERCLLAHTEWYIHSILYFLQYTLPRAAAADPPVPLRRRRSNSFDEYFCATDQFYLTPSPYHLRRINSVEVLLSEDMDSTVDTPYQKHMVPDGSATDSPVNEYSLHHSTSPIPIPGPLEDQKRHRNLESEGSSTPITPHIISVGSNTSCSRGILEHIGMVRVVHEESRLGFDFPRKRDRSHSRQSSASSIHIITAADTRPTRASPLKPGLDKTQPHSSCHTTHVGISRDHFNTQASDFDLHVGSPQQFSSDYLSVDLVSSVDEQPLLQTISSSIASVAPILTHGLSVVVILFAKYIS